MSIEKKITITIDAKNAQRQLNAMNKLIKDNAKESKKAADDSIASGKKEEAAFEKRASKRLSSHRSLQRQLKAGAKEQQSINDRTARNERRDASEFKSLLKERLSTHNRLQRAIISGAKEKVAADNKAIASSRIRTASARKLGLAEIAAYKEANRRANPKTSAPSGVGRAVGAVSLAVTARELVRLVDGYAEFTNRLRTATKSEQELLEVQKKIVDIAKETRTGLEENGLLYLRLAKATDNAGTSSAELLKITSTVNKAVQIGGSSAQEAAGAIRQFTQIISAGFSSGFSQEINSLAEQTPGLFDVIVDGLRETSQEFRDLEDSGMSGIKILKEFSEKGIGDLDTLLKAVASQGAAVDKQFLAIRPTITKSINVFRTALQAYIGTADQATGASSKVAEAIETLSDNIHLIAGAAMVAGGALSGALVRGLISSTAAMFTASKAAKGLLFTINPFFAIVGAVVGVVLAFKSIQAPTVDATKKMSNFAKATQFAREELNKLSQLDLKNSIGAFRDEISTINDTIAGLYSTEDILALQKRKKDAQDILDVSADQGVRLTARSKDRQESIIKAAEADIALLMALADIEKAELLNQRQKIQSDLDALDVEANNRTITGKAMLANDRIVAAELAFSKELQIRKKYKKIIEDIEGDIKTSGDPAYEARANATIAIIKKQFKAELDAIDQVLIAKLKQQEIEEGIDKRNSLASAASIAKKREQRESALPAEIAAIEDYYSFIEEARNEDIMLSGKAIQDEINKRRFSSESEISSIKAYENEKQKIEQGIDSRNRDAQAASLAAQRNQRENSLDAEISAIELFYGRIEELRNKDNMSNGKALQDQLNKRREAGEAERDGIIKYDEETARKKLEVNQLMSGALVEMMNSQSEELFEIGKAGSIASAIMSTYAGMAKALEQGGVFGIATAAAVGLAGASQIANIGSTKFGDKGMKGTSMTDPVAAQSNITNNTQSSQTTINITGGVGFTTDDLTALFDSDAVIINRDSAQGRALR